MDLLHLSAGELLRQELNSGSHEAKIIEHHMKSGTIVPVEITCGLLHKQMILNNNKVNTLPNI
jgi:UMP-CMP kinase